MTKVNKGIDGSSYSVDNFISLIKSVSRQSDKSNINEGVYAVNSLVSNLNRNIRYNELQLIGRVLEKYNYELIESSTMSLTDIKLVKERQGNGISLKLNGKEYRYVPKPDSDKTSEELVKSALDMMKHGAGLKALNFIKKHTYCYYGANQPKGGDLIESDDQDQLDQDTQSFKIDQEKLSVAYDTHNYDVGSSLIDLLSDVYKMDIGKDYVLADKGSKVIINNSSIVKKRKWVMKFRNDICMDPTSNMEESTILNYSTDELRIDLSDGRVNDLIPLNLSEITNKSVGEEVWMLVDDTLHRGNISKVTTLKSSTDKDIVRINIILSKGGLRSVSSAIKGPLVFKSSDIDAAYYAMEG